MRFVFFLLSVVAALNIGHKEASVAAPQHVQKTLATALTQQPEVDKEGYEADWLTEHKSGPYPEEAKGKEHHPDFSETVKHTMHPGWQFWDWFMCALLVAGVLTVGFMYSRKE